MFRRTSTRVGLATAGLLTLAFGVVTAQAPAVRRTILQKADISVPGREVVTARAEMPTSGSTGKHTHPGEEVSYVVDGMITLEVEGRPTEVLKAGDVFIIPAGTVHGATKGKPLTTQVN